MAIFSELMYAILAMDSYNRGYNPGIEGLGGIGSSIGDGIGNATVVSEDRSSDAQDAGFYAVAYERRQTIISYRGTDSKGELLGTDYPIAVNDDYDEVRVFPSKRIPHAETSSDRKYDFWVRAEPKGTWRRSICWSSIDECRIL